MFSPITIHLVGLTNYSEIVEKYIAQYNEKKGVLKSASMTVVKTSVLKSFSESLKELINHDVTVPDISTILQYDQEATSWLFDIGGFVSQNHCRSSHKAEAL